MNEDFVFSQLGRLYAQNIYFAKQLADQSGLINELQLKLSKEIPFAPGNKGETDNSDSLR